MKSVILILALFLFSCSTPNDECSKILFSIEQCFNNEETVTICHPVLKGEELQWSEITVSFRSLPSHLFHGDHITTSSCNCNSEQLIVYKSY